MHRIFNSFGRGVACKVSPNNNSLASVQHDEFETKNVSLTSTQIKPYKDVDVFLHLNKCRNNTIVLNSYKFSRFNIGTSFGNQSYPVSIEYDQQQESNHNSDEQQRSGYGEDNSSFYINLTGFCMKSLTLGSLLQLSRTFFSYHRDVLKHIHAYNGPNDRCVYIKAKQLAKNAAIPRNLTVVNGIKAAPVSPNATTIKKSKPKKVRINDNHLENKIPSASEVTTNSCTSSPTSKCSNEQSNAESNAGLEEFTNISKDCSGASFNIMGIRSLKKGDYKTALSYFEEGSSTGHSKSQFNLALCYERGIGVKQNVDKAIQLYSRAAWQGHTGSLYNLALHLIKSQLVAQQVEALHLLEAAADRGLLQAQTFLGSFMTKKGLHQDFEKAVKMLKLAAAQGDALSMYQLGVCYENGLGGLVSDKIKAYELYKTSASNDNVPAHYNMAALLERGEAGVAINVEVVKQLYEYAANKGHVSSKKRLKQIKAHEKKMSSVRNALDNSQQCQKLPVTTEPNKSSVLFFIGPDVITQACKEEACPIFNKVVQKNFEKVPFYSLKNHKSLASFDQSFPVSSKLSHLHHHNISCPASLSLS